MELIGILSEVFIASDSKYYFITQVYLNGAGIFVSCFIFWPPVFDRFEWPSKNHHSVIKVNSYFNIKYNFFF
jgi:hypothetical protein